MVTLPPQFVATKYPGYFWNTATKTLYTAKNGVLKEMKRSRPCRFNFMFDGYKVSVNGQRRLLRMNYLQSLTPGDSVFPVWTPPDY